MDIPTDHAGQDAAALPPRPEPRQRWRLTFARANTPDVEASGGREYVASWEVALAGSGLPLATTDAGRIRFALAAPLPARTAGRAELADVWLTERVAAWQVREALASALPSGHELVGLEDVWLGAPALAGRIAAADYVVTLREGAGVDTIAAAAKRLLATDRLVRERAKGGAVKTYDLRPLVMAIDVTGAGVSGADEAGIVVRIRTRIHPELGSGRPEEVIAALAEESGATLEVGKTIRDGLVLSEDLDG